MHTQYSITVTLTNDLQLNEAMTKLIIFRSVVFYNIGNGKNILNRAGIVLDQSNQKFFLNKIAIFFRSLQV